MTVNEIDFNQLPGLFEKFKTARYILIKVSNQINFGY